MYCMFMKYGEQVNYGQEELNEFLKVRVMLSALAVCR